MKAFALVLCANFVAIFAQSPIIRYNEHSDVLAACLSQNEVTLEQFNNLNAQSVNCEDVFGRNASARCVHTCRLQAAKFIDSAGNLNVLGIYAYYFPLNTELIDQMLLNCMNEYAQVATGAPCELAYHVNKCMDLGAGLYPPGTKHVPVALPADDKILEQCVAQTGVTPEELCKAYSDAEQDGFRDGNNAQCYIMCEFERMGYIVNNRLDFERLKKRYWFVQDDAQIQRVVDECSTPVKEATRCQDLYVILVCLKTSFKEFPLAVGINAEI